MVSRQDQKAYLKLAQLHTVLRYAYNDSDFEFIKKILEKEGDIDYPLPKDGRQKILGPRYIGCTALHLAHVMDKKDLFVHLIKQGADFTKRNEDGQTVLHMSIDWSRIFNGPLDCVFLNSVLTAHIERNNCSNPCNKNGFTHFHVACMSSNGTAVKFFLDNGVSVDEPTNSNSTFLPEYTPLHIATMYTNTKIIEILLAYGANMHILDANGKTPLHVLVEWRMEMVNSMYDLSNNFTLDEEDSFEKRQVIFEENEKIIHMLLENASSDNECLDSIGLSNFHVSCMLQDTSIAERLADQCVDLNLCVSKDSKLWAGYTALHFAAHFSLSTVKMLIMKGANIELRDAKGLTPLDICIERFSVQDIGSIIALYEKWEQIILSDGETKLVSLIHALADTNSFKRFIILSKKDVNLFIPLESALWPGYSPLHLAVLFSERPKLTFISQHREEENKIALQIIRFCLSQGADVSMQDSRGRTPLHLAFRLNKKTAIDVTFRHCREIPNSLDEENLSHLHIVCATGNKKHKLKKCVVKAGQANEPYKGTSSVDLVRPGSTPLHVLLSDPSYGDNCNNIINALLKLGADPNVKDSYGMSPIHWLLDHRRSFENETAANKLLKKLPAADCVAEDHGISYLHVACHLDNCDAVKRFVESGSDVNLAIKCTTRGDDKDDPLQSIASRFDKCTPLHIRPYSLRGTDKLLLRHGADVFARKADGTTPLESNRIFRNFLATARNDERALRRLRSEFGLTRLHLACQWMESDGFGDVVEAELTDVDARTFSDSPFYKGQTPLHMLSQDSRSTYSHADARILSMTRILLEHGSDVSVLDDELNSPIGVLIAEPMNKIVTEHATLLMKYHTNFNVNPVNDQGMSHFHMACYLNDVDAVRGFLLHGADVNRPIDFFSDYLPGCTPLHLASKLPVVDLLISHGADVHIEDVNGYTALHEAVRRDRFDESVVAKIIENGADINSPNFRGMTPFESAIIDNEISIDKLQFFIEQGFPVNSCNPITGIGYISLVLSLHYRDKKLQNSIVEAMMRESSINVLGRTTLHHLVTSCRSNVVFIQKLLKSGHDIDEQDGEGKTALHLAVELRGAKAVNGLLVSGADINVQDSNGHSPLFFATTKSKQRSTGNDSATDSLAIHACRLVLLQLDLNQLNASVLSNVRQAIHNYAVRPKFLEEVERSKEIEIGVRAMRLHDFLSETGVVAMYPSLNQLERQQIDQFFESINSDDRVQEIRSFLNLQYRKAVKRPDFIVSATNSLRSLLGFDLPDLCAENIFLHLSNSSLKNLIEAGIDIENMRMEVD